MAICVKECWRSVRQMKLENVFHNEWKEVLWDQCTSQKSEGNNWKFKHDRESEFFKGFHVASKKTSRVNGKPITWIIFFKCTGDLNCRVRSSLSINEYNPLLTFFLTRRPPFFPKGLKKVRAFFRSVTGLPSFLLLFPNIVVELVASSRRAVLKQGHSAFKQVEAEDNFNVTYR